MSTSNAVFQMTEHLATSTKASFVCLFLIIGCAGVLDVFVARSMSTTYDEPQFIAYGEQILHFRPDRSDPLFNSKSPVAALNATPRIIAAYLDAKGISSPTLRILRSIRFARLASVIATLFLNFFVYCWARDLYGPTAAIAVSIMIIFSPNLIAHGTLANNDGYFALGVITSLYFFRRYLLHPTFRSACLSGVALALAQLTKSFAIYLYAVVLVFIVLVSYARTSHSPFPSRKDWTAFLSISFVLFLLVTNAGFCFDRTFTPLKSYRFDSASFVRLQKVPVLRSLPLPLPYPFLQGLDMMKYHDDSGLTYGKIYLLGELRDPYDPQFHSFKSYYAVAMFFKEPIPLQILCLLGLVWTWKNRRYQELLTAEGVLLVAAAMLFIWFSLFRKSELGIRNILPVLAINIVIAGAAFSSFAVKPLRTRILLGLLVLWMCVSTMSYYPNMIPYMNEWVFDRKQSYKILVDSNLDFGQDGDLVHEFLERNPDVILDPQRPLPGRVLVSVNRLVGEWHGYEPMLWLLRYKPVAHVGYGHLLFVVPARDIAIPYRLPCRRRAPKLNRRNSSQC
jgi:Dolichyl-phosphate-mannose-protein mannosyltransferase